MLLPLNENIKCDCLQSNCPYCGQKIVNMEKINLEEIWLNNVNKFENISESTIWTIGKHSMKEAIKQALELDAENVEIDYQGGIAGVNKQSIFDIIKLIK